MFSSHAQMNFSFIRPKRASKVTIYPMAIGVDPEKDILSYIIHKGDLQRVKWDIGAHESVRSILTSNEDVVAAETNAHASATHVAVVKVSFFLLCPYIIAQRDPMVLAIVI